MKDLKVLWTIFQRPRSLSMILLIISSPISICYKWQVASYGHSSMLALLGTLLMHTGIGLYVTGVLMQHRYSSKISPKSQSSPLGVQLGWVWGQPGLNLRYDDPNPSPTQPDNPPNPGLTQDMMILNPSPTQPDNQPNQAFKLVSSGCRG